eukprot:41572-Amphidinium_carterae.1
MASQSRRGRGQEQNDCTRLGKAELFSFVPELEIYSYAFLARSSRIRLIFVKLVGSPSEVGLRAIARVQC